MTPPCSSMADSTERALIFGAFLDALSKPTPNQLWLERAAAELRQQSDPDGSKSRTKRAIVLRLLKRDGPDCWFCGHSMHEDDMSIEHLQPRALQGSWADDNLALAHKGCNKAAGHLTRFEKEKLRDEMRLKALSHTVKGLGNG
jgi:hypothetical protein